MHMCVCVCVCVCVKHPFWTNLSGPPSHASYCAQTSRASIGAKVLMFPDPRWAPSSATSGTSFALLLTQLDPGSPGAPSGWWATPAGDVGRRGTFCCRCVVPRSNRVMHACTSCSMPFAVSAGTGEFRQHSANRLSAAGIRWSRKRPRQCTDRPAQRPRQSAADMAHPWHISLTRQGRKAL
jgi:hypothetical protein